MGKQSLTDELKKQDLQSCKSRGKKPDDKPTLPPTDTGVDERVLEYVSAVKQKTK